jgi:hypothetical protein
MRKLVRGRARRELPPRVALLSGRSFPSFLELEEMADSKKASARDGPFVVTAASQNFLRAFQHANAVGGLLFRGRRAASPRRERRRSEWASARM